MTRPSTPACVSRTGQWRLAMDPGAFAVGAPDMAQLLAATQATVTLARGEHDAMNTGEQLTRLGVPAITLPMIESRRMQTGSKGDDYSSRTRSNTA